MDVSSSSTTKQLSLTKPLLIFVLVSFLILSFWVIKTVPIQPLVSPLAKPNLQTAIEPVMWGTKATYGVVVKNLKTNESYISNEHQSFEAASLYKLWVMATAMKQIEEGTLKEDEVLSADVASLNKTFDLSPEVAELSEGTITLSVKDALKQMITISHNYAALLLSEKVKLSNVRKFLKEQDLNESTMGEDGPRTSALDIAKFFEKLYLGKLASQESTQKMIELLKGQQLNNKLPKYLAKELIIAHKTGEIGQFSHDGGIVYWTGGDYIIVVLSQSDQPVAAEDRIAKLSKAVYEYFNHN